MRNVLQITAVVCVTYLCGSARGDAPLIHCTGTESGGSGPRQYAYRVDAASFPMIEFAVGTNDLDRDHYYNVLTPAGWNFSIEPDRMSHIRGLKTRHGEYSPGPCWCLTEGRARWWTDDPTFAVEYFVFGYDHPWRSEDVGWILHTRREGPPPQSYSASESWQADVGTGMGPVHGPCAPAMNCLSNDECEPGDYCEFLVGTCAAPGTTRRQPHGCPAVWDPICGCDGITYPNACQAAMPGVSIAYDEACMQGDSNLDGSVDLGDYVMFADCMFGPGGGTLPDCAATDFDDDNDVDLSDLHIFYILLSVASSPRISDYSNSGCLPDTTRPLADGYPFCGEDQFELTAGPGTLRLLHTNATYNCCVDDIRISLSLEGAVIRLTEEELLTMGGCHCLCCYDTEATVVNLSAGIYTVEFCWYDYDTGREECHIEDIEIPLHAETVESNRSREASPSVEPGELAELVAGNSAFAFDLYQAIREGQDNLFYSPHSISIALAMTYAGARTETEVQMSETMHFTLGQERLHTTFNALDLELAHRGEGAAGQDGEGFRLNIVNAIWGQTGYSFLSEFLDVLAENYGAGLRLLDFFSAPEPCRIVINDWVSDQTEGRIEDLIPQGVITPLTRLVLTNAVYFNAAWKYPFEEEFTTEGTFHLLDGSQVTVPMMSQTQVFGYAQGDGYEVVELLYDGDELSMVILLPEAGVFGEFESSLDAQRLANILSDVGPTNVALTVPRFTYESKLGLKDILPGMGMLNAFIPGLADFSGIDGTYRLFISDVLHKAFIAVDEAGTEAAAATAVVLVETSVPPPPIEVSVNRPFIFLIRDIATEAILFVGRVQAPSV